ncbi:DUF7507 domain-containing protein [Paracoccus tegillarcae]|uniref:Uncharacterized protein n=1 Tax=Paracoccus tegillarcae TaxID=1529068 RepID=A0A2K9EI41_9RHOB|nr:Ig-like domain-containing protein [Paracoccus tegillarcae]AUH33027.1 hypothetical protein CUV01_06135 [Paracoccus tegillarcae]
MALTKSSTIDVGGDGTVSAGDLITYEYTITNTGSSTIFNPAVTENAGSFTGTGPVPTTFTLVPALGTGGNYDAGADANDIRPGEFVVYEATYALTPADLSAGQVTNSAQASGQNFHGQTATDTNSDDPSTSAPDDATVTNFSAPIAVNDTPPAISGADGGTTATVLVNDTLNGAQADLSNITLTPGTAPAPAAGSITMNPDGTITVAPGTTAGTYSYLYTICDIANPTSCNSARATIVVDAPVIDAVDDAPAAVNGAVESTTPSVLANDTLNGAPVDPADITLTPGAAPAPAAGSITMNPDGTITVAAGTTAGTYSYPYEICEILNPTNCATAVATVVVDPPVIEAVDDTPAALNGFEGGDTPSVLGNDTLNGDPVVPADVTLTPGTAPAPASGSITMNPDGTITVAPGTTAGTYTYPYEICEVLNPTNCATAVATVVVDPPVIEAVDDTPAALNGFEGGDTPSVLGNDTLNGDPVVPADVTLTPGTAPAPAAGSITMDPATGVITVAPGTTAGTYSYPYEICEVLNATNCATAVATVVVDPPVIEAVDDTPAALNGFEGGDTPSVLGNDTLNGDPVVPADVTLTPGTAPAPASGSIAMNPDGTITIAPGTTAGTYSYPYEICEILNPTNCATAVATVVVEQPVIEALDDTPAALNGFEGGDTPSVLGNDTLNGAPVDPADITLTPGAAPAPASGSITMDPATGVITVAPGTTAGTYTYPYEICEALNPTNCATAVATVVVEQPVIEALDDTPTAVSGIAGATLPTVLANDTLNGAPVDPADITLTPGAAPVPASGSITMNPDGTITVAPGTTAGTYSYPYEICDLVNPTNCSTATATVIVDQAVIDAVDDAPAPVGGIEGGTTDSVLDNDSLNGEPVDPADVTLTPGAAPTSASGSITMNPDGTITVAANTTAGTYTYEYTICEILNPANCDTAIATVVVEAAPIGAVDDSYPPLNGFDGGDTPSVLDNDTLNGEPVDPGDVTLTPGTAPAPASGSITMNPDGTITVAANTTAGTYTYEYTICEILNPDNCDTAIATVVVESAPIEAVDDSYPPLNGFDGGNTPSVLDNDTLNGEPVDPADVTLTPGTAPAPASGSITMNPDGTITVAAGTTAGTYTYEYTICEILNPDNCDTAIATVVVEAAPIEAVDESTAPVDGASGGTTESVLDNDTLNGVAVDPADVTLTPGALDVTPVDGSITMNPDGTITIAEGTTPGSYEYSYTICEILNPENCDTAIATVVVTDSGITLEKTGALDDGGDGVANAGDVINYSFVVTNTGTVPLTDVTVTDPLVEVVGGPIASLAAGASDATSFTASYTLTQDDLDAGQVLNQALASGTDQYGNTIEDTSDDPSDATDSDPNGDGNPDDATIVLLPEAPQIEVLKSGALDLGANGSTNVGDVINYNFVVTNTGNVTLTDVELNDPGAIVSGGPIPELAPGDSDEVTFTAMHALTQADLDAGEYLNTATAVGSSPQGGRVQDVSDDAEEGDADGADDTPTVIVLALPAPTIEATKTVSNRNPIMGETIIYTLTFENTGLAAVPDLSLIDLLPARVQYVPGTATVDGVAAEPSAAGRQLVWQPYDLDAGQTVTVAFDARVTALDAGETAVNQAWVETDAGTRISNIAEAEITRRAEHVFDCTDVIGKVFDDKDMDGYQDEGELGMAAVRIATLNGELITTDEHGRFSVPCAAMPPGIGENLSLKLDTRSLPTGYRVTTENPRVVRATAGKMVRVNFGVSVGRVVDIDLMAAAFGSGSAAMTRPLYDGLSQLVEQIREKPGIVRLSYYTKGEERGLVDARIDAVESRINELWQKRGRYKLIIERTVKRIQ